MSEDERDIIKGTDGFFTDEPDVSEEIDQEPAADEAIGEASITETVTEADSEGTEPAVAEIKPDAAEEIEKDPEPEQTEETENAKPDISKAEKKAKRKKQREKRKTEINELREKTTETVHQVRKEIELDDRKLKETSPSSRRFLLGLAVVIVVVAAVIFLFSDRFYNSMQGKSSYVLLDTGNSVSYIEGNSMLLLHKGNMLRCSQDGLLALNPSGGVVYDIPFTMSSPYVVSAGDYVSVADRLGMLLILVKDGQIQTSVKPESTILLNTVNAVGETAVILNAVDGNILNLYNAEGEELMKRRTFATTDGVPLAIALSDDGSRLATAYANYTGSVLQSIVTVFDLTETGSALVDRIVGSLILDEEVVSDIQFIGDELFYVTTDSIGRVTANVAVDTVWQKDLDYEIKTLARGEDYFAVWYGNGLAGTAKAVENNVVVYNYSGDILNEMNVPDISYMDAWGDTVVYSSGRVFYGVSTTGKPKWSLNTGDSFTNLVAYENGKTVAATQNGSIRFFKVTLRGAELNDEYGN